MKVDFKFDDKELAQVLKQSSKAIDKASDEVLKLTTAHIEGQAKQNAPVGKYPSRWARKGGFLRRGIKKSLKNGAYEVQSTADYSLWVEYGTRKTKAQPFFRPAIKNGLNYMDALIKRLL